MAEYNSLTLDQIAEKIDRMPDTARMFMSSDEFETKLNEIIKKYELNDALDEISYLKQMIVLLGAWVITKEDFPAEVRAALYLDNNASQKLADEILNMLRPVLPVAPIGKIQINPPKVTPEPKPAPVSIPEVAAKATSPAPFIIHEQKEIAPQAGSKFELARPTFIKPQFKAPPSGFNSSGRSVENQAPAKIDFGSGLLNAKLNPVPPAKSAEPIKRVDYTSRPAEKAQPKSVKNAVDPNTIDLRDLPK